MTTTANKGTNRAGAAARRKRHAQRTPLPGDTARPVRGNPTAEAIQDELKTAKPRARKRAVPPPPRPARDTRTFGDKTDELASAVKEQRDAGALWKDVAAALDLGAGKTGTSRARRLYKVANAGTAAPRKTAARAKATHTVRILTPTGVVVEEVAHAPVAASLPSWGIEARDKRRGRGTQRLCPINASPLGSQQVRNLRAVLEPQGYTVTTVKV